jgi:hypothetical protein
MAEAKTGQEKWQENQKGEKRRENPGKQEWWKAGGGKSAGKDAVNVRGKRGAWKASHGGDCQTRPV